MRNLVQLKTSRLVRSARLAASAVAVAGVALILAGAANASPADNADKAPYRHSEARFKHPKLKHGLLEIKGTSASDRIALRLQASQLGVLQVDVGDDGSADFAFERAAVARIAINARAGNDLVRIDESNGAFTDSIPTTTDGKAGDDTLLGGSGTETLRGGPGKDLIDGNRGNDVAFMGAGDDTFVWDPGDGSDTIEGQSGDDTMLFNGAGGPEQVDLSANGNRLRFFRTQGTITMDTAGVERVDFKALGGADLVTVNDLSATDVRAVNVDLADTLGGATGDGQPDRVVVNGTNGDDRISINGGADGVNVSGLAATVRVLHSEAANDRLEINTLAGSDTVNSGGLASGVIQLFVDVPAA
jgi:RTX calcium-binding nonapeptide repeat (4 copies)